MSKEKQELVKVVMLVAAKDKNDNKVHYEVGAEIELPQERAEAAVAKGYAKIAEPEV
jgi:hypothetical protein